jgi:hypothetical protein
MQLMPPNNLQYHQKIYIYILSLKKRIIVVTITSDQTVLSHSLLRLDLKEFRQGQLSGLFRSALARSILKGHHQHWLVTMMHRQTTAVS